MCVLSMFLIVVVVVQLLLDANPVDLKFVGRQSAVDDVVKAWSERIRNSNRNHHSNPIQLVHCYPGGGKTRLLVELSSSPQLQVYGLTNDYVPVCICFRIQTTSRYIEYPESQVALRMLHRY